MPINADRRKLLLRLMPQGLPVTRKWLLIRPEFDRHAIDNLVKSHQLKVISQGVYQDPTSPIKWEGVVICLQNIHGLDLVVGGLSALELQGYMHYLPLSGERIIHLYGPDHFPHWVDTLNERLPDVKFQRHSALKGLGTTGIISRSWGSSPTEDLQRYMLSTAERAYLELLKSVPDSISFEYADQLLQGMTSLSPVRLETLLRACRDIKVRRLFYWLAARQRHQWFERLPDPEKLDDLGLGKGYRMLIKGGKLDTRYLITVPEEMWTRRTPTTAK